MEQTNNINQQPYQASYKIMTDIIDLPSEGLLYSNKQSQVTYEYMCANDESILLSPGLIKSNKQFDELIRVKVKDLDMSPTDLLPCDYNAILLQLRVTAYGEIYETRVTSPFTGTEFDAEVDITLFETKGFAEKPDSDGLFTYRTKKGKVIKYRVLTMGQIKMLSSVAEAASKMNGGKYNLLVEKMKKQIVSIDGENIEGKLAIMIERMPILEAREIRKHFNEVEAGLDLNYEFTCPDTAQTFRSSVQLGTDFFYPES